MMRLRWRSVLWIPRQSPQCKAGYLRSKLYATRILGCESLTCGEAEVLDLAKLAVVIVLMRYQLQGSLLSMVDTRMIDRGQRSTNLQLVDIALGSNREIKCQMLYPEGWVILENTVHSIGRVITAETGFADASWCLPRRWIYWFELAYSPRHRVSNSTSTAQSRQHLWGSIIACSVGRKRRRHSSQ